MSQTLLQLVTDHCRRTAVPVPTTVSGATDAQVLQMLGLLNELLDDLVTRDNFTPLQRECVFVSINSMDQGSVASLLPNGDTMWKVVPKTFFNRTTHLECEGPITETEWQQYMALNAGMLPRFRFWKQHLWLQPTPPTGHTYAFEYLSQQCILDAGGNYKRYFTDDADTSVVDDSVLKAGLRWKWKAEKGLDYTEEFRNYEALRASYSMPAGLKPFINVAEKGRLEGPGIIVPPGSWANPGPR